MLTEEQRRIGRRNFLKALATLPVLGAFGAAARQKGRHDRPLQVGIIGSGSEGCVLLEQSPTDLMEYKALADIRPDSRANGASTIKQRWGEQPQVYPDDYRKLLERDDIEAVVIATPLSLHAQMTVDALDAGKHVFVEKTMAWSVEHCKQMVLAARRNRRVLQVGHQRHSNRLYASALNMIRQGLIGDVYYIRTLWHRNTDWRRPVPDLAELRKADPKFDPKRWGYGDLDQLVNWRHYRKYSGGLMAELGSHQLDVTNWFTGAVPRRVIGSGGRFWWKGPGDVDDHVYVTCEYPANQLSPTGTTVTFSSITSNKFDDYYEQFEGAKGTIMLTGETEAMLWSEEGDKSTAIEVKQSAAGGAVMAASASRVADAAGTPVAAGAPAGAGEAAASGLDRLEPYRQELGAFCSAIKYRTPPPCTGEEALAAAIVILKANEAIARRQPIELDDKIYAV